MSKSVNHVEIGYKSDQNKFIFVLRKFCCKLL